MRSRAVAAIMVAGALTLSATGCKIETGSRGNDAQAHAPAHSVIDTSYIHKGWKDKKFKPTGIVLHWWGYQNGSNIQAFANSLHQHHTEFDPRARSKAQAKAMAVAGTSGPLGVQIAVGKNGVAYQLTPTLDTFARHAKCANNWAIGIEIEGTGPSIINNKAQRAKVIATVKELQAEFNIPTNGSVSKDGMSGSGVHSHKQVDVVGCRWANGDSMTENKPDVNDAYLAYIKRHLN